MAGVEQGSGGGETPEERIERLVREGKMPREAVDRAEQLWQERLRHGVLMPNGQTVAIELDDVYHAIVDSRIWRKPERIERMLQAVFELRTAELGRTTALARWDEGGALLVGRIILDSDGRLRSIHVVDDRKIRREMRRGSLLWRR